MDFIHSLPWYKQEGVEPAVFPYILVEIVASIIMYLKSNHLLQHHEYFEKDIPEDVLTIVREIDKNEQEKEQIEESSEKKSTLEERVQHSFTKSQQYGQDKSSFRIVQSVFSTIIDTITIVSGFNPFVYDIAKQLTTPFHLQDSEIAVSLVFLLIQSIFEQIVQLPWDLYRDFIIEEKHGFNKKTGSLFFKDLIKNFIIEMIINIPIYSLFIFILHRTGRNAIFYLWIAFMLFSIVLNMLYPIVIMPLFNKMSPMEESPLRDRIYELAGKVGFKIGRIQVIDSSQRTGHSNAAAYGFFGVNGILIYDNLLKQLTDDEIIAVIGHELGHWKHGHTYRLLIFNAIYSFFMFNSFSFFVFNDDLYRSFGFKETPVVIGFVLFTSTIWVQIDFILSIMSSILSRRYEFQADQFATELGYGHELKTSLTKLEVENSSSLRDHWLVSLLRDDHPSLTQRCIHISELEKKME